MTEPRIAPLSDDELDDQARELLAKVGLPAGESMHIFSTLVRHPRLFRRWLPLGGVLLSGELPAREREIVILRTAHHCHAVYEQSHHVEIGARVGLTADEMRDIRTDPHEAHWDPFDLVLMDAADDLHLNSSIGDRTWAALTERYDDKQLIELTMLVGQYHLVAYALNSLGVQLEDGFSPA